MKIRRRLHYWRLIHKFILKKEMQAVKLIIKDMRHSMRFNMINDNLLN